MGRCGILNPDLRATDVCLETLHALPYRHPYAVEAHCRQVGLAVRPKFVVHDVCPEFVLLGVCSWFGLLGVRPWFVLQEVCLMFALLEVCPRFVSVINFEQMHICTYKCA